MKQNTGNAKYERAEKLTEATFNQDTEHESIIDHAFKLLS